MSIEQAREVKRLLELFDKRQIQKGNIMKLFQEGKHEEIANIAINALGECAAYIADEIDRIK